MPAVKERKASQRTMGKAPARTDAVVTARVPVEIKEQGDAVLKRIGSTPTELINATYRYVIEHGELPRAYPSLEDLRGQHRTLAPEQEERLRERIRATTLKVPDDWEGRSFKELLDEARGDRYARFA